MSKGENHPAKTPEELFTIPSQLRLRQLLGQMSVSPVFEEELFPSIIRLGEEQTTPEDLVLSLEENLTDFADEHLMGARSIAYKHMPGLISVLTWGQDEPRGKAMDFWGELIEEQSTEPSASTDEKRKLPRKIRKTMNKPPSRRSAREQARLAKALERKKS